MRKEGREMGEGDGVGGGWRGEGSVASGVNSVPKYLHPPPVSGRPIDLPFTLLRLSFINLRRTRLQAPVRRTPELINYGFYESLVYTPAE